MIQLRRAAENEAEFLTELASRSKSYWPYDDDYLRGCREVTQVTPDDIRLWPFIVAIEKDTIIGFAAVCEVKSENMLDHLWIDPEYVRKGVGRILFAESVKSAKNLCWSHFTIAADPYAEAFYLKMGAVRIGERESKIKKGFFLPLLEYHLSDGP